MRSPWCSFTKKIQFRKGRSRSNNEVWEINREQALIEFERTLVMMTHQFDLDCLKAFTIFRDKNEWCNHFVDGENFEKINLSKIACDDSFDLRYRMQATDAWCLYDSFLCERVKKEIRKRNKKTGKQSSVPPFIFIANAKRAALMFALKICERWRKIVCVWERERKKYIWREKITQRERELLWYLSGMLRS